MYNDMEIQIHHLEQEAYCSVLRAFKAQADAITWEKESLITELRKELRVSDDEHRVLLARVNVDDTIKRIREWRQSVGNQTALLNPSQAMLNARRKQKILSSVPSLSSGMQSAPHHFHSTNASMPSLSLDHGNTSGRRHKKSKADFPSGPLGARHVVNPSLAARIHSDSAESNPIIGKRVMTRWPDDNNFYEAVITDYDPQQGRHCLVYDKDTPTETSEWVALDELPQDHLRWVGEDLTEFVAGGVGGQAPVEGTNIAKSQSALAQQVPKENGNAKTLPEYIEVYDTDKLISEVEKVFNSENPDPAEVALARRRLSEQEQALMEAIEILSRVTDEDSAEEPLPPGPPVQQ